MFCNYGIDYINSAINILSKKTKTHSFDFFVFSDDVDWCKSELVNKLNNVKSVTVVENEKDYIDFYLMSMCKHNIITNSTFSWWSAYLNQNPAKIVIMPEHWFNKDHKMGKIYNEKQLHVSGWIIV